MNAKRYLNLSLVYAILAMVEGVFYREFTKVLGYTARTTLGLVHTHYFMLGMLLFLVLAVVEKSFSFTTAQTRRVLVVYHVGLNLTAVMLVVRGVVQVMGITLSAAAGGAVSGIAGLGHILLGVALVLLLLQIRRAAGQDAN